MDNSRKTRFIIGALALVLCIAWAIFDNRKEENALKNGALVKALIWNKEKSSRSTIRISVKYDYKGQHMNSGFSTESDTFKVNEWILLKISTERPGEYMRVVKKLK